MTDREAPRSFNPAHAVIAVYIGLALAAVVLLGPSLAEPATALVVLSARYASLLLSTLPLVVAASLWSAAVNLIPLRAFSASTLRCVLQPLPIDPRLSGQRARHPAGLAASAAWHPLTIVAVALTFGANSGFTLFFIVFSVVVVSVGTLTWRRLGGSAILNGELARADAVHEPKPADTAPATRFSDMLSTELYHRLRLTVLGLLIVVAIHVATPPSLVRFFTANPAASVPATVLLAFLLSVPAEAAPFAAALFFGTTSHGAVLAFVLVSAICPARALLPAWNATGAARATLIRSSLGFTLAAVVLIVLLTLPISDFAAGGLW